MKGNEALAEAAIRAGVDAYFGYPITPQSEVIEYLMTERPELRTGMVVLQAESEVAAINMVYGAASTGKKVMTSSSSPGISLKQEGISYMAGAELPAVIVNVVRGGPGLGTIQPSQADYFQSVKGGGHGDYKLYVLAPASVQEMSDFVTDAFDIAFKYRAPVLILSDGLIGQMMEKVVLKDQVERISDKDLIKMNGYWATTGKKDRERNIITSLDLQSEKMEARVHRLQKKYVKMELEDLRYETIDCEDADYLIVAYGSSARISQKAVELARKKGIKVGLLRPITLFPFPKKQLFDLANQVKGILSVELNAGQMVEDVKLAVEHKVPVEHFGRTGGIIHTPEEVLEALEQKIINHGHFRHHKTRESSIL
ncbi:MAG: 3-methyl-2-oxobutanoate dehydrogenase subunit VorB [Flavobacteriales bacterium]|nr:3-methyl-2-oxobutanoate dehydrogenase subunit VorB [Flavobacteriia bacterium]NCP06572.1 3-methyl-2-oxobutanoate dehydrogenase subunit VorB [Flavobacteriales bacterium]PIV92812.1 MAG: 3-methyl-2-oxobutanoate dehydrogenase subunit VorB [Flavobacteriaceae bacterium CG17_big_fil_post_rev_8_21_14_2_50_33_15]PIY13210.1 MAG: 3-methyl-2-oxobutanoate dehydrogenase subunit VorB [Flavobacteriaceae bacterium CG_4_10_14_3_um_filter_33_47]PJB18256.1 MAG: 3-methyl-2-oxobutanoate dehydrogenase subunit VorB 